MKNEEGYIKFNPIWNPSVLSIEQDSLNELNAIRSLLMGKNWIGELPDGIGFGNISIRLGETEQFLITGSGTGGISQLENQHLAIVEKVDIKRNSLSCTGETLASSESMTHAVLYHHNKSIKAVIHIHCNKLWQKHLYVMPTSDKNALYGTPEMAHSISQLLLEINKNSGLIIMGGHSDGLIAFGKDLNEAFNLLLKIDSADSFH